jgi:hypothetical protein
MSTDREDVTGVPHLLGKTNTGKSEYYEAADRPPFFILFAPKIKHAIWSYFSLAKTPSTLREREKYDGNRTDMAPA